MVATHLELLTQRVVLQQFEVNHARLLFFFFFTCSPELQALLMNQLTVKVRLQSLFFTDSSANLAAHECVFSYISFCTICIS